MAVPSSRFAIAEARVGRVLIALMALGFASLLAAFVAIAWMTARNADYTGSVLHTQEVRQAIADTQVVLEQSETTRRGYLLTRQPLFADGYRRTAARLRPQLEGLRRLTIDNPSQTRRIDRILARLPELSALRGRTLALARAGDIASAQRGFGDDASVPLVRALRARLAAMAAEEVRLLGLRTARQRANNRLFIIVASASAVLLAVVAMFSLLVTLRNRRDLTASRDELRRLNGGLEAIVAERTADLTRANEEIQRFAYIVSHDLRSPLVNVMGFTAELETANAHLRELVDRAETDCPGALTEEARMAAREDMPEAIGFIRSSTHKMDRLINAILKLSREGRRTITPEALDLPRIVAGVRDTIQHRLEQTGTELSVEEPMPRLVSDRLAVEQILSNLIENAVKYLQPGRPGKVAVRGRAVAGQIVIEVEDNGRGIDARDHARVFDLFRRSGVQDQPGEGIGLAHVRALTHRLGGVVDMTSELGQGTTFRVTLPAIAQDQDCKR